MYRIMTMLLALVLTAASAAVPFTHAVAEENTMNITIDLTAGGKPISPYIYGINQYGNQIRKVVLQTLENLDVKDVKISVVDKGALDCTIKARVEGAVFRSADQIKDIPWGGAVR